METKSRVPTYALVWAFTFNLISLFVTVYLGVSDKTALRNAILAAGGPVLTTLFLIASGSSLAASIWATAQYKKALKMTADAAVTSQAVENTATNDIRSLTEAHAVELATTTSKINNEWEARQWESMKTHNVTVDDLKAHLAVAEARANAAEAPEKSLASSAGTAVRCRVVAVQPDVALQQLRLHVVVENRLRTTGIWVDDWCVRPILKLPGGVKLPVPSLAKVDRDMRRTYLRPLDQEPFICWIPLPKMPGGALAGKELVGHMVTVDSVEGHCTVSGPWGERVDVLVALRLPELILLPVPIDGGKNDGAPNGDTTS